MPFTETTFPFGASTFVGVVQQIAFAATITPDPNAGSLILVGTLTGNITVANTTNPIQGQVMTFRFVEDVTGGRTISFGTAYRTNWTPNTAANLKNIISFFYDGVLTQWLQMFATVGLAA